MKPLHILFLLLALVSSSPAGQKSAQGRTIGEIDVIPTGILQRSVSPRFYKTLLISPIEGWVVVRGNLSGTHLSGLKVVHSEPNKLNDHLALQRAREVTLAGNFKLDRPHTTSAVLVHLLLYKTADGTLALSFAHVDGAGGNQMQYYGCARLAVLKNDGTWVNIKGPDTLEGKGVAVRQGVKNDFQSTMKLERFSQGAESTIMSGH